MSEENIALRLKFLIDNLSLSSSQFADKCDIARPTLSQLLSGRNKKISNLIIEQIHKAYPGLSIVWLMFGEGDMWSSTSSSPDAENQSADKGVIKVEDSSAADGRSSNTVGRGGSALQQSDSASIDAGDGLFGGQTAAGLRSGPKNPRENLESRMVGGAASEYCKENGVNLSQGASANSNNENVNQALCSAEILSQLGKIKEKTRKVVQITVYYDDSTFQTFYPNK